MEVQTKKLKKVGDPTTRMPLTMYDLTRQEKKVVCKASKDYEDPNTQVNAAKHPIKEVYEIAPLQIIFP